MKLFPETLKMHRSLKSFSQIEWLPFLPILLAPFLLLIGPLLTGRALFWGLPALQFNPWRWYAWENLRQGVIPLWNPLNGMGAPLAANYQLALFYPPGWLAFLIAALGGAPAMAWAHTLLVALHLAWAGAGMALLLRTLGMNRLAQTFGGLAFGLCGYFTARTSVFAMIWTGAWLPWVILFASQIAVPGNKTRETTRFIPTGLVASLAFMLLAGHAQLSWYTLLLGGAWVLVGGWSQDHWKGMLLAGGRFILAGLLAAGIAAIQIIPTGEYLLQSQRAASVDYYLALAYSFWPWRLLGFVAPNLFGSPGLGNYWGYAAYWEDAVYIGLLPFLLALGTVGMIHIRKKAEECQPHSGLVAFLWVIILLAFLLAFGWNTPVFPFLYRHIPTFNMFQAPTRYTILVVFALALLAGIGTHRWRKPGGRRLRGLKRVIVAAFAVTIGAGASYFLLKGIRIASFVPATALAGMWGLGAGLLVLRMPPVDETKRWQRWSWVAAAWVATDLLAAAWGLAPSAPADLYKANDPATAPVQTALNGGRVYLSQKEEYAIKFWRFFRFGDFGALENWDHIRATLLPNLNLLDGIPSANNFDPLVPARYATWMQRLEKMTSEERAPWLEIMGVSLIEQIDVTIPKGVEYLPLPKPRREYWTSCAFSIEGEESAYSKIRELLVENDRDWVVLESAGLLPGCQKDSTATIRNTGENGGEMTYEVNAGQNGWLVTADTWYPGWEVTVDGTSTHILRANDLFRAIAVPAGSHTIVFRYRPRSYLLGALISGLALLILSGERIWRSGARGAR